jgi:hypothetical protein
MQKRGAIGLSINMLVVIIMSIVILVGGIAFLYKMIGDTEGIQKSLNEGTRRELDRLIMGQGKRVAIAFQSQTLNRGDSHIFGIGILNIDSTLSDFYMDVQVSKFTDKTGVELTNTVDVDEWVRYSRGPYPILENEMHSESIRIEVPKTAESGEYIFNARVYSSVIAAGNEYGNTQKFYVMVK